jgi:hypothetical protein
MQMFEVKHFSKENGDPIATGWRMVNSELLTTYFYPDRKNGADFPIN